MNELKIIDKQEFMGREIQVLEGGFGENQRIITVKQIAEIHEVEMKRINELINDNLDEFEEGIDIIDLMKDENSLNLAKGLGLITNNRQKNCYILSEQGYMLLTSFMRTDKAKEIRKQFRREYFVMREVIKSDEQLKKELLLKLYNGGIDSVEAHKQLSALETKHLTERIETMQPSVDMAQKRRASDGLYTYTDCQKKFGLKQGQVGSYLKVKGYVHWVKKETTKLGDDTGFVRQYGEEFPNIGVTELGLKFLEDNLDELKSTPCKLPKRKQDWIDENK